MNAKRPRMLDRQAQIELLRMRTTLEREALCLHSRTLQQELSPQHWLQNFSRRPGGHFIQQGLTMATQYPYVISAATSLIFGKRWRNARWLGLTLAVCQAVVARRDHSSS